MVFCQKVGRGGNGQNMADISMQVEFPAYLSVDSMPLTEAYDGGCERSKFGSFKCFLMKSTSSWIAEILCIQRSCTFVVAELQGITSSIVKWGVEMKEVRSCWEPEGGRIGKTPWPLGIKSLKKSSDKVWQQDQYSSALVFPLRQILGSIQEVHETNSQISSDILFWLNQR